MKKLLLIISIFSLIFVSEFCSFSSANDDENNQSMVDMLKYSDTFTNPFAGQKQITDEDFNKALEQVKANQQKKKKKKNEKKLEEKSIKVNNEGDYIEEKSEAISVVNIPLTLISSDGTVLNAGYYKVLGSKTPSETVLNLFQGHSLIAKIPVIETDYDFEQEEVNFVKIVPFDLKRVKFIYGSIDFNAYTFLYLPEKP